MPPDFCNRHARRISCLRVPRLHDCDPDAVSRRVVWRCSTGRLPTQSSAAATTSVAQDEQRRSAPAAWLLAGRSSHRGRIAPPDIRRQLRGGAAHDSFRYPAVLGAGDCIGDISLTRGRPLSSDDVRNRSHPCMDVASGKRPFGVVVASLAARHAATHDRSPQPGRRRDARSRPRPTATALRSERA